MNTIPEELTKSNNCVATDKISSASLTSNKLNYPITWPSNCFYDHAMVKHFNAKDITNNSSSVNSISGKCNSSYSINNNSISIAIATTTTINKLLKPSLCTDESISFLTDKSIATDTCDIDTDPSVGVGICKEINIDEYSDHLDIAITKSHDEAVLTYWLDYQDRELRKASKKLHRRAWEYINQYRSRSTNTSLDSGSDSMIARSRENQATVGFSDNSLPPFNYFNSKSSNSGDLSAMPKPKLNFTKARLAEPANCQSINNNNNQPKENKNMYFRKLAKAMYFKKRAKAKAYKYMAKEKESYKKAIRKDGSSYRNEGLGNELLIRDCAYTDANPNSNTNTDVHTYAHTHTHTHTHIETKQILKALGALLLMVAANEAFAFDLNAGITAAVKPFHEAVKTWWPFGVGLPACFGAMVGEGDLRTRGKNAGVGALVGGGVTLGLLGAMGAIATATGT